MQASSFIAWALVAAFGLADDAPPGYRFREGRKLNGQLSLETDWAGEHPTNRKQTIDFDWTEGKVEEDGSCRIRVRYQKLRWDQTGTKHGRVDPNHWFEVTKSGVRSNDDHVLKRPYMKSVVGAVLEFTLTREGKTKQVRVPAFFEKVKDRLNLDAHIGDVMSNGRAARQPVVMMLPQFPGEALKAGRKWQGAQPRVTEAINTTELAPTFLVKSLPADDAKALLVLGVEYEARAIARQRGGSVDASIDYRTATGAVRFDLKQGILVESTAEVANRHKIWDDSRITQTCKWKMTLSKPDGE